jgi:hypothetical protein
MRQMVRFEAELSAGVDRFSANLGGQCCPFPDDQNIQERNRTVWTYLHSDWMEGLKLWRGMTMETDPVSETLCSLIF